MKSSSPQTRTRIKGGSFLIEQRELEEIFTPEDFTDQHRLIAQAAQEFIDREIVPRIPDIERRNPALLRELLKKAAEIGLPSTDVPQKYGGIELDKVSSAIVAEKMARNGSWTATIGAQAGIATLPIAYFGTETQKSKYVPKLASCERVGAYALSEAGSGSDALNCKSRATLSPDGKSYILNGTKMWITNGGFADLFIVFAKVDGEKFTAFIVERGYAGVTPGAEEHKMGLRGSSTTPVNFENVAVPIENVLGEIGKGHLVAFNTLNIGRFKLGAGCVGAAKNLLAESICWAKDRDAFGRKLADFGLIQEKIGQMTALTYAMESISYRTAGVIDRWLEGVDLSSPAAAGEILSALKEYAIECSILKVVGTEGLDWIADEAVQIFGGYGFSSDYEVERAFRDQRVNRIFEGTNEINRLLITDMLLKRSMSGELALIPAAQRLMDEAIALPADGTPDDQPLAIESAMVEGAKKALLLIAGSAVQKFMTGLTEEQEVVGAIANIVMAVYAMESVLLRTVKRLSHASPETCSSELSAAQLSIYNGADQIEAEGRRALARIAEGDMLRSQLAMLRRFLRRLPPDTVGLRRRLAARAIELGRYPFQ